MLNGEEKLHNGVDEDWIAYWTWIDDQHEVSFTYQIIRFDLTTQSYELRLCQL